MTIIERAPRLLIAVATSLALCLPLAGPASAATAPTITIDSPTAVVPAGAVTIHGTVNAGSATDTTSVLYVMDASGSTQRATACADLNGADGPDVLDCEIAAVRSLNTSLVGTSDRIQTGLEAFTETAEVASLDNAAFLPFAAPGYTGGLAEPRLDTVANSVTLSHIGQFVDIDLSGRGTNFQQAIDKAVEALAATPAGPKWVFLLSDGGRSTTVLPDLTALAASGVKVRTFNLNSSSCTSLLERIAAATGESCVPVTDPAALSAQLTDSQPADIRAVTVSLGGQFFAADVDAVGGWRVNVVLGQGTYPVTATASLSSGQSVSATRTITVGAPSPETVPGTVSPAPGTVAPATGTLLATKVAVKRPASNRHRLPKTVTGSVGAFGPRPVATPALNGATVKLQGRSRDAGTWVTYAKAVVVKGEYTLTWKRHSTVRYLQVRLSQHMSYASSAASVPPAPISACRVTKTDSGRILKCHTIAKPGTKAKLLRAGDVLDRDRVSRRGLVKVHVRNKFTGTVLKVYASKHTFKLHL